MKAKLREVSEVVTDRGDRRFFAELELLPETTMGELPAAEVSVIRRNLGKQVIVDPDDELPTIGEEKLTYKGHDYHHVPHLCTGLCDS